MLSLELLGSKEESGVEKPINVLEISMPEDRKKAEKPDFRELITESDKAHIVEAITTGLVGNLDRLELAFYAYFLPLSYDQWVDVDNKIHSEQDATLRLDIVNSGVIDRHTSSNDINAFDTASAFAHIKQTLSNPLYSVGFGTDPVITLEAEFDRIINNYRVLDDAFVSLSEMAFLVNTTIALPDIRDNVYIPDDLIQDNLLDEIVNEENLSHAQSIGPYSEKIARMLFYLRVLSPEKFEDYISKMDEYDWEEMEAPIRALRKNAEESHDSQVGPKWKRFAKAAFHLSVISADRIEITDEGLKVFYDEKPKEHENNDERKVPKLPSIRRF